MLCYNLIDLCLNSSMKKQSKPEQEKDIADATETL